MCASAHEFSARTGCGDGNARGTVALRIFRVRRGQPGRVCRVRLFLLLLLPPFSLRRTAAALGIFLCFALLGTGLVHFAARDYAAGRAEGEYTVSGTVESAAVRNGFASVTLSALYFDGERNDGEDGSHASRRRGAGGRCHCFHDNGDAECVLVGRRPLCAQRFCRGDEVCRVAVGISCHGQDVECLFAAQRGAL